MAGVDGSFHASIVPPGTGVIQVLENYVAATRQCWRAEIEIGIDDDDQVWQFSLTAVVSSGKTVLTERFGLMIGASPDGSSYFLTIGSGLMSEMVHRIAHELLGVGPAPFSGHDAVQVYEDIDRICRPSDVEWP